MELDEFKQRIKEKGQRKLFSQSADELEGYIRKRTDPLLTESKIILV